jgi:hypothetical protein
VRSFKRDGAVVRDEGTGQLRDDELSAEQLAELRIPPALHVLAVLPGYDVKSFAQRLLGKACAEGDVAAAREAIRFAADPNLAWYRIDGGLDGVETPAIVASWRELSVAYALLKLLMSIPGADKRHCSQVLLGIAIKAGDAHLCRRAISGGALREVSVYDLFGKMSNDASQAASVYHCLAAEKLAMLSSHDPVLLLSDLPPPRPSPTPRARTSFLPWLMSSSIIIGNKQTQSP